MDTRIPEEMRKAVAAQVTIEDHVVEGLNTVFDKMMDTCAAKGMHHAEFVRQVAKAAEEYAEECYQQPEAWQ